MKNQKTYVDALILECDNLTSQNEGKDFECANEALKLATMIWAYSKAILE